jgi:hypothetical protein
MKRLSKQNRIAHRTLFIALGIVMLITTLPVLLIFTRQMAVGATVRVTIDPSQTGKPMSRSFMGISSEPAVSPCLQNALQSQNPTLLENILKNLGPGTFRIGGDSVERASWSTSGTGSCSWSGTIQTPSMVNLFVAIMKKVGWKFIWGVNLKNGNSANDARNAAYVMRAAGGTLVGIEIGNEPNLYGWSYSQYQTKWEAIASAIKAAGSNIPLVGPAGTNCCTDFYTPFINAEGTKIILATDHYYPTANATTFQKLLSPSLMQRDIQSLQSRMQLASAKNLPYQLGETNAVANVPPANIGDAFGISLWLLDYSMRLAEMGAAGMNVHGWSGDATSILYPDYTPRPNYYGMLAFHYAAANGNILPARVNGGSINLTAYAIKSSNGNLQVVLINKDLSQSATVSINTTQSYAKASDIRLSAPSVDATSGIMLGGSAVAADGSWSPKTIDPVSVTGATSIINVSAASAVLITYSNTPGTVTSVP